MTQPQTISMKELLKQSITCTFKNLDIYENTITLLGGKPNTGKTSLCTHIANECIQNKKKVIYVDTDEHPLSMRPHPNILKKLGEQYPELYDKYFIYTSEYDEDWIIKTLKETKPAVLIIDSIYAPYVKINPEASRLRGKQIKKFLITKLRPTMYETRTAVIITTSVSSLWDKSAGKRVNVLLGGEGLQHGSDTKWVLHFADPEGAMGHTSKHVNERLLSIDLQEEVHITIGTGGVIEGVVRDVPA